MALYSIKEETLVDVADALRRKHGETKLVQAGDTIVVKSANAIGFDNIGDNNSEALSVYVVKIPNAVEIKVLLSFKSNGYSNDMRLISGEYDLSSYPRGSSEDIDFSSTSVTRQEYVFKNTDAVSIYKNIGNKGGYYIEFVGLQNVDNVYSSSEMAQAIDDIVVGAVPPKDGIILTGDCKYKFTNGTWDWVIESCGDKITTTDITDSSHMFVKSGITELPFDINFKDGGGACSYFFNECKNLISVPSIDFKQTSYKECGNMFYSCNSIEEIGDLKNLYPSGMAYFFANCYKLRYVPNFPNLNLSRIKTYAYATVNNMFMACKSLRSIPEEFLKQFASIGTSSSYASFSGAFGSCHSLDEIRGMNPTTGNLTNNVFGTTSSGSFSHCNRVKNIMFAIQDDGTPYTVNWKNQTIDLSLYVGYAASTAYTYEILNNNSGITADKEVTDDATYQALKNDPDWFTILPEYSRYNKDSALATIQSLPDTSAYGVNTIKFKGTAGSATDGGAINTLTAEEIAVATAKGWTVTLS